MPNRILKESICTSDTIDQIGWFDEVVFYRLIVNCDDYGRFDGRAAIIKNRLFPLKESTTIKNVELSIHKLATVGLVTLYTVGGKPFLQLPTWEKHQSVRAKKSKYPSPDDKDQTMESNCMQMHADDCKCPRNPIQSNPIRESNPYPNPNPTRAGGEDEETAELFRLWDRAAGKIMSRMQAEQLQALLIEYGLERMNQAISIASEHNAVNIAYLRAVLQGKGKKWGATKSPENDAALKAIEAEMMQT